MNAWIAPAIGLLSGAAAFSSRPHGLLGAVGPQRAASGGARP